MSKYEVALTSYGTCRKAAFVVVEAENESQAIKLAREMNDVEYVEINYEERDRDDDGARLIKKQGD